MLGVDIVRIGMEDSVYLYPDKNERVKSNAQLVELIVQIAELLGREIATPDEARQILHLDPAADIDPARLAPAALSAPARIRG